VSFEIRPADTFWNSFHELPTPVQEGVRDVLELTRDHPGELIDRNATYPIHAVATRPTRVEAEGRTLWFAVLFQYDADERTIHLVELAFIAEES
jgi:hypothetical protein